MERRTGFKTGELKEIRKLIKEKTGYYIRSNMITHQIFIRSSFAAETGLSSNEIFEYQGDSILSYYVMKVISKRCGSIGLTDAYTFRINESQFTNIKQSLVNNDYLAQIIDEWDLAQYLLLSESDFKNEVIKQTKVKADLLEAIIGAIAIDCNWDQDILETTVVKTLDLESKITSLIQNDRKVKQVNIDNAISVLKELAEKGECTMPKYDYTEAGYDNDGNPIWICSCSIINNVTGISKLVFASSKKDAKKAVAYLILCEHLEMQNQYGPNSILIEWSYKDGKLTPTVHL